MITTQRKLRFVLDANLRHVRDYNPDVGYITDDKVTTFFPQHMNGKRWILQTLDKRIIRTIPRVMGYEITHTPYGEKGGEDDYFEASKDFSSLSEAEREITDLISYVEREGR